MNLAEIFKKYKGITQIQKICSFITNEDQKRIVFTKLLGSAPSMLAAYFIQLEKIQNPLFFVLPDKEEAAYFFNDLEGLFGEKEVRQKDKSILFFPASVKKEFTFNKPDPDYLLMRSDFIQKMLEGKKINAVVSYPEACAEKIITPKTYAKYVVSVNVGMQTDMELFKTKLDQHGFTLSSFVYEPGQYAVRGGIIDVFTFGYEQPKRIVFDDDIIESIRSFDIETQLSTEEHKSIKIMPDLENQVTLEQKRVVFDILEKDTLLWISDMQFIAEKVEQVKIQSEEYFSKADLEDEYARSSLAFSDSDSFIKKMLNFKTIEFKTRYSKKHDKTIEFNTESQRSFSKNIESFIQTLESNYKNGITNYIFTENPQQIKRLNSIIEDHAAVKSNPEKLLISCEMSLHEGFTDYDLKIAVFTDHQIFERYHKYHLRERSAKRAAISLKEFYDLKPGDFIVHIDHGIGRFAGLEKMVMNGREQESIKLVYKDNDVLNISIHSLHKLSRYSGKEGAEPKMHKLGTASWTQLKQKATKKVKAIAIDLIKLYAERKMKKAFAFSPDSFLQYELEASFFYEDTPDQQKATQDVKQDMESVHPMDRLVCGDVGFGKTEVAIRASFKAATDGKQVAVLVPTTILALQHFHTFSQRLEKFPVKIDFLSRFKNRSDQKKTIAALAKGEIDILIGTHRLLSKDIQFQDLGLVIVDEEQKFGVAAKEKLRTIKTEVDTLALTATPIPRTLQFSLMAARDLSVINTPPPNRYPITTELHVFNQDIIRDAIINEYKRNGQVFFIHNRVQNIQEIADFIRRICPEVTIAIAHGKMEPASLEKVMYDFINHDFDLLLCTTIIESGVDIPNVNTIIINNAHHIGLSDLHQLRGRVGRTNKKAFCYLLTPPLIQVTQNAQKRIAALEEFSELGSGFNIAMRDLDIRGAGNLLGAEQSGFIAEMGYDVFHKILDEAIAELKQNEGKDIAADDISQKSISNDCQIDTDLELLIPEKYVADIRERLNLYKRLDYSKDKHDLIKFENELTDRFGRIPEQTLELIRLIKLRWVGQLLGMEKINIRNNMLVGQFVTNENSEFFNGPVFGRILDHVKSNPNTCYLKEKNGTLFIYLKHINSISAALDVLNPVAQINEESTFYV